MAPRSWQWPVFSTKGYRSPASVSLQLLLAGDIETNPGPHTCPICTTRITASRAGGGSVCCNSCGRWIHLRCTTLNTLTDYTINWNCYLCHSTRNQQAPIPQASPVRPAQPAATTATTNSPATGPQTQIPNHPTSPTTNNPRTTPPNRLTNPTQRTNILRNERRNINILREITYEIH